MERVVEVLILIAMAVAFIVFKFKPVLSMQIAISAFIAFIGLIAFIEIKESDTDG